MNKQFYMKAFFNNKSEFQDFYLDKRTMNENKSIKKIQEKTLSFD